MPFDWDKEVIYAKKFFFCYCFFLGWGVGWGVMLGQSQPFSGYEPAQVAGCPQFEHSKFP